jgi:hypothetical protein
VALSNWKGSPKIFTERYGTSFGCRGSWKMRRDDLMKRDMVSEVILLGSGIVIALAVIITLIAAFTRTGSLP